MSAEAKVVIGPVLKGNEDIVCELTPPKPAEQFEIVPQVFPLQDAAPGSKP